MAVVGKLNAMCALFYTISYNTVHGRRQENDASSGNDRLQCCRQQQIVRSTILQPRAQEWKQTRYFCLVQ